MEHNVDIWYDKAGNIVAWGHVSESAPIQIKAKPLAEGDQGVITVRLSDNELRTLHESHYVEPGSKQLARRKGDERVL
jgi:hypothetical protein